jgi:hypothetical protein
VKIEEINQIKVSDIQNKKETKQNVELKSEGKKGDSNGT